MSDERDKFERIWVWTDYESSPKNFWTNYDPGDATEYVRATPFVDAAPDMLAALKEAWMALTTIYPDEAKVSRWIMIVDRAIAKAEGRE